MKLFTLSLIATGALIQPGSASIGRGADLICQLFCGGIAEFFVELFGKRDLEGIWPSKRQGGNAPPGVPQFEFDRCYDELQQNGGVTVRVTSPSPDALQFDNVPPTCMNLANVLFGDGTGPFAQPCGSACLVYNGLSQAEYDGLLEAVRAA